MNFTPELSAFQGVILSADNTQAFSKITARGGNEDHILDIVSSMFTFLREKQYISTEGITEKAKSELRKFAFYLILNADFPVLEDLIEMPGIDIVIWTVPTITKCLLCEMFWGLNMDSFLAEVIAFCNPLMALQVLQPFVDSIKHSTPVQCHRKLQILSGSSYRLICRLHFFKNDNSLISTMLSDIFEHFLRCIAYYLTPPNAEKLDRLSEDDKYKHMGNNLHSLLSLALECLTLFTSNEKFDPEGFEDMYLCTIKPENIKTRNLTHIISEIQDGPILEYLSKCNTALLDKCMELIMEINVDIFCAWSEFDDNGKTMQQSVGELCYLLKSKLATIPVLCDHPVAHMLPQISCKPVDIHDIIRAADIDTVIDNINNSHENKSLWLQALIQKEDLCQNTKSIQCLIRNVEFINEEECAKLLDISLAYLENNESQDDLLHCLAVKLIIQLEEAEKNEIMAHHFRNKTFNNRLENSETASMVTETFNKLVATPEAKITDVLNVFVQNPSATFTRILQTAVENVKQCEIMLKVMEMLQKYSDHFYVTDTEPCIVKIIQSYPHTKLETDAQRNNFANFIIELKKFGFLSGAKLLLLIVMPNLHKGLLTKDNILLQIQIKILRGSYNVEELKQYRAPILVMLAQVLEATRWSPSAFTGNSHAELLEDTLGLQIEIMNSYNDVIPDNELNWMRSKLRKLAPLNMYYYRKLWDPPGNDMIEIISGTKLNTAQELTMFMAKVLYQATSREWAELWEALLSRGRIAALELFYKTVTVMAMAEAMAEGQDRTDNTWSCLKYCYWNLLLLTKNNFLTDPITDDQVETVISQLVKMVNLMEERDAEDISTPLTSVLSYIAQKHNTVVIANLATNIKHSKIRLMVNQVLS